ncbi:MAG TPA: 50S ribosomal protein L18 [Candidatus Thermoplasmatota archaeon]|nr:50S ribosomal protein L18 [Candidatus Thermoplasmatota archaeon]
MSTGPRTRVPFRRRREGRTDYRARLALLKSGEVRLVVRRTATNVIVQFVDWAEAGDQVKATAVAQELGKMGWEGSTKNTPAAYLTGLLAGKRAAEKGVKDAVLDIGQRKPSKGGRVFAALQGVLDAGIQVPHGEGLTPAKERLTGAFLGQDKNFEAVRAKIGIRAATSANDEEA